MNQNDTQKQQAFAKKAYIEFSKLKQLRDNLSKIKNLGLYALNTVIKQYNETLSICSELLQSDIEFANAIKSLSSIQEIERRAHGGWSPSQYDKIAKIQANSGILLSTLQSFITWYLPVEKQRTIGFQREE